MVPEDGRNLNRSFPGDPHGSFTDVLAHHVFSEFVTGSDVLIDLHGGDMVEALEPFALYDDSAVREAQSGWPESFGLRYVVCDTSDTLGGTTSAAAAPGGIPAFIAEAGGRGLLEPIEVERHVRDCAARCAPRACSTASPIRLWKVSSWYSVFCGCARLAAAGGSRRLRSARRSRPATASGTVLDGYGDVIDTITAPEAGVPLFLTSSPAVQPDGLLLGLGAGLREF